MEHPSQPSAPPPTIDASRMSLFLDFDGTLVELADQPDGVTVSSELASLLERLASKLDGRLAVVSGRSLAQLDHFFGPFSRSAAMVGSHGAEVRTRGSEATAPDRPEALREAQQQFSGAFRENKGVLIEVKTLGVAIHYRLDPAAEVEAHRLATDFASRHALELQRGKMMVEVRSPGHDKGSGIATLMSMPPFTGSVPLFLGDDLTDEPGFHRCAEMGGAGVLVGVPRPSGSE